jgi:hypothetical protein
MEHRLQKQSWPQVLLLSIITLGIYIPFWFKKVRGGLKDFSSDNLVKAMIFTSIGTIVFNISFDFYSNNGSVTRPHYFDTNYYNLGDLLRLANVALFLILSFGLKSFLEGNYKTQINPVMTFLFGPVYLQHKINIIMEAGVQQIGHNQNMNTGQPEIRQVPNDKPPIPPGDESLMK